MRDIEFVDQNPLSRNSRSNPVTYLKAYDDIRRLFSEQPLANQLGFTPAHFSFNTPGGRCEACQGEGSITIEMQFMADLVLECEQCHGRRFKQDVLDVHYRGKSIYDILCMTVNQAVDFFSEDPKCERIVKRLKSLQLKDAHKAQDIAAIDKAMAELNTAFQAASAHIESTHNDEHHHDGRNGRHGNKRMPDDSEDAFLD